LTGFTCSTGSIDLAARASAILPNPRADFHAVSRAEARDYSSPRRYQSLQLFCPVEDDRDLQRGVVSEQHFARAEQAENFVRTEA